MKTVSVIVPVYNVEKYLDECVASIVGQTYKDLEIILVNDGSPDSCPQKCEEWAKKDERVFAYHKPNGGLADARNFGLSRATGEYIAFVDSDDRVSPLFIEKMVSAMERDRSDMAVCRYVEVFGEKIKQPVTSSRKFTLTEQVVSPKQAVVLLSSMKITPHAWRRMYKRELLPENPFPKGKNYEDMQIMWRLTSECNAVSVVNDALYFYRRSKNSITFIFTIKNMTDKLDGIEASYKGTLQTYPDLSPVLSNYLLMFLMDTWCDYYAGYDKTNAEEWKRIRERIVGLMKLIRMKDIKYTEMKFALIMIKVCPRLYASFQNLVFRSSWEE